MTAIPTPGEWAARVAPDGRIAQLAQLGHGNGGPTAPAWLCMTWPDGVLTATLLTEDEVAAWTPLPLPPRPSQGG